MSTELLEMATLVARLKEEKAEVEERLKKVQHQLVLQMEAEGADVVKLPDGRTAVVVSPERTVIDEVKLKKKLGARKYATIVKTTVDKDKLEAKVASGAIDMLDVAECATVVPSAKYIKVVGRKQP